MRPFILALALLAPALAPAAAWAQIPARIRGTVGSLSGDTLIVNETAGDKVTVHLNADAAMRADSKATVAAITPGSTLGIVSKGPSADKQVATAIRIVPTGSMARLGQFPWDLPQSTMTNGVVEGQGISATDRTMTLKAGGEVVHMGIAPDANIATVGAGNRSMLVPGTKIVVFAKPGAGDTMTGLAVEIGENGLTPPL